MKPTKDSLRQTAVTALESLKKIKIANFRNPFSRKGGFISRKLRDNKVVALEQTGMKRSGINPTAALRFLIDAREGEKSKFYKARISLEIASANLRAAFSAEHIRLSMFMLESAAKELSQAASEIRNYDTEMSATLHGEAGEILYGMGNYFSAQEKFARASNYTSCPITWAAYSEKATDINSFSRPQADIGAYERILEKLAESPIPNDSAEARIKRKIASCYFLLGNENAAMGYLLQSGMEPDFADKEMWAMRALANGDYPKAIGDMGEVIREEGDILTRKEHASRYLMVFNKRTAEVAAEHGVGSDEANNSGNAESEFRGIFYMGE